MYDLNVIKNNQIDVNEKLKKAYRVRRIGRGMLLLIVIGNAISFFNSPEDNSSYLKKQIPFYSFIIVVTALFIFVEWRFQRKKAMHAKNIAPTNQPDGQYPPTTLLPQQQINPAIVAPSNNIPPNPQQPDIINGVYTSTQPVQPQPVSQQPGQQ